LQLLLLLLLLVKLALGRTRDALVGEVADGADGGVSWTI